MESGAEGTQRISRPDLSNFPRKGNFLNPLSSYSKVFERPAHCSTAARDVED
jgi:hypothetical protein